MRAPVTRCLLQAAWGQGRAKALLEGASALAEDMMTVWEDDARKCKARRLPLNLIGTITISRHFDREDKEEAWGGANQINRILFR